LRNFVFGIFASGSVVPFTPVTRAVALVLALPLAAFQVWLALWGVLTPIEIGLAFMIPMLIIATLTSGPRPDSERIGWFEVAMAVAVAIAGGYLLSESTRFSTWIMGISRFGTADLIAGAALIFVVLVIMKRRVGMGMTAIVLLLMAYLAFGHRLDGFLSHRQFSFTEIIEQSIISSNGGLFGTPVAAAALYVYLFVVFGKILQSSGGGQFFFELAASLTGGLRGGVAKVAVVSSGLFGMISGSPTSDVVTTGSITIPMMKRLGYPAHAAAAIETVASVGGSFLPPIMGAVVFLMVEYTGISYGNIIYASIGVGILYYLGVLSQVHFYSVRHGFGALDEDVPGTWQVLRKGWIFLLPIAILVYLIESGRTAQYSVVIAIAFVIVLSWVNRQRENRLGPKRLALLLVEATAMMAPLIAAVAGAGLVEQVLNVTGLGSKLSFVMFEMANGNQALVLLFAAAVTIVFGMGMPVPAVYALAAILLAPGMANAGFGLLETHLFLVWFSVASHVTPPIAIAAYVAATIASAEPIRTSVWAARFGLLVFLLPFAFILRPGLLLQGDALTILGDLTIVTGAMLLMAPAAVGFYATLLPGWMRAVLIVCGVVAMMAAAMPWLAWSSLVVGIVVLFGSARMGRATDRAGGQVKLASKGADERG
jgi:TRAP transporter 4TM/12TM fusion protein